MGHQWKEMGVSFGGYCVDGQMVDELDIVGLMWRARWVNVPSR